METSVENTSTTDFPVIFVVRKQTLSKAWQLPQETFSGILSYTSYRTVCVSEHMPGSLMSEDFQNDDMVTVEVSSLSPVPIRFSLLLRSGCNKLIKGKVFQTNVSMTSPQVFHFEESDVENFKSDVIAISLMSEDTQCLTVSIQSPEVLFS